VAEGRVGMMFWKMSVLIKRKGSKFIRERGEGIIEQDAEDILSIEPYDAYNFNIYHKDKSLFASCKPSSNFRCILITEDFFIGDLHFLNEDKEIIRINFRRLFGLDRSLIHEEFEIPLRR